MCDQHCCHGIIERRNFLHMYMKQHSRMTAWLQQTRWHLNNFNTPHKCKCNESQPVSSSPWHPNQRKNSSMPINPEQSVHHRISIPVNPDQAVHQRMGSIPINPEQPVLPVTGEHHMLKECYESEEEEEELKTSESDRKFGGSPVIPVTGEYRMLKEYFESEESGTSESDSSEDEIEFNGDAIFNHKELKTASEMEIFLKLENDPYEDFEYVELGSFETLGSRRAVVKDSTEIEQKQDEKQDMKFLYGDEATKVAGLEACMKVNFNRWFDDLEPLLWPVLPIKF